MLKLLRKIRFNPSIINDLIKYALFVSTRIFRGDKKMKLT